MSVQPELGTDANLGTALRQRGLRSTPQRRQVLDAVGRLGHATPEQILADVSRDGDPGMSLSTVYRTLELLERLELLTHTHLGHGSPTYHLSQHADHVHLVCRVCGTVEGIGLDAAAALAARVQAEHGFAVDVQHVALHGVCARCQTEEHR